MRFVPHLLLATTESGAHVAMGALSAAGRQDPDLGRSTSFYLYYFHSTVRYISLESVQSSPPLLLLRQNTLRFLLVYNRELCDWLCYGPFMGLLILSAKPKVEPRVLHAAIQRIAVEIRRLAFARRVPSATEPVFSENMMGLVLLCPLCRHLRSISRCFWR